MRRRSALSRILIDTRPFLAPVGLARCGLTLPASPVAVYAEDFSLLVRFRRLRIARSHIRVLS